MLGKFWSKNILDYCTFFIVDLFANAKCVFDN